MINGLWNWMDRRLDPTARTGEDTGVPMREWAAREWEEFEQPGATLCHIKDDICGCPACHAVWAVEVFRFLTEVNTPRGKRTHGATFVEYRAKLAALGVCRCELQLGEETARRWAIAELAPYLAKG